MHAPRPASGAPSGMGRALEWGVLWARAAKGLGMSKTDTITSSTSLSSPLVLTNGETLSVAKGVQVTGGNASYLIGAQPNASGVAIDNSGSLVAAGNTESAVSLGGGGVISNASGALIAGGENGIAAQGSLVLANAGTILGYDANGLSNMASSLRLPGQSSFAAPQDADPASTDGGHGNSLHGLLQGQGPQNGIGDINNILEQVGSAAPGFDDDAVSVAGSVPIANSGMISSTGGAGIYVQAQGASMLDITNDMGATISGLNAIDVVGTPSAGTTFTLVNAGTIDAIPSGSTNDPGGWGGSDGSGDQGGSRGRGDQNGQEQGHSGANYPGIAVLDTNSPAQVIIDPTGTFEGRVLAGDTAAMNSITLASGTQPGMITNLGTFLGFQSLYEQSGANWTIADNLGKNTPVITVGSSADLTLDQNVKHGVTVNIAPAGTLTLADLDGGKQDRHQFAGEIGTVGLGSEIDFANLPYDSKDTLTVNLSGKSPDLVLSATGEMTGRHPKSYNENITIDLDPSVSYNGDTFQLVQGPNGTEAIEVICFTTGTQIATPAGEVPVERLQPGDEVLTASGAVRKVKWVGKRSLNLASHPHPEKLRPVCIRAHAFGENLPRRDLWVSPGHAIHWQGALIPAERLLNGASVYQADVGFVTYHHVELESHDLLISEGLASESYLDAGNRGNFEGEDGFVLHPDLSAAAEGAAEGCLPRLFEGPVVASARAHLLSRLAPLGFERGAEAETVLGEVWAAERRLGEVWAAERRLGELRVGENAILIPAGVERVELRSSTFVPAGLDPACEDCRVLGVRLLALALDGEAISLDAPVLARGFHGVEPDGRWTDGAGLLALAPSSRPRTLSLTLAPRPGGWHAAPGPVRHAA